MWNGKWRRSWTLAYGTEKSSTSFIGKATDPTNAPGNLLHTFRTPPKRSPCFINVTQTAPHLRISRSALRRAAVDDRTHSE